MPLVPNWLKRTSLFGRLLRAGLHTPALHPLLITAPAHDLFATFVRSGDLVFDVGANYGNRLRSFLNLGATVVAIEPQPDCARALRRWFGKNPQVRLVPLALGRKPGMTELHLSNYPTLSSCSPQWISSLQKSGRFTLSNWSKTVSVPVTTLDALIRQFGRPTYIKIDVEGFESEVIQGLSQPVPFISLECASESVDNILTCLNHLERMGPFEGNFSWGETGTWAFSQWRDACAIRDFLCQVLPNTTDFGDLYLRFSPISHR